MLFVNRKQKSPFLQLSLVSFLLSTITPSVSGDDAEEGQLVHSSGSVWRGGQS